VQAAGWTSIAEQTRVRGPNGLAPSVGTQSLDVAPSNGFTLMLESRDPLPVVLQLQISAGSELVGSKMGRAKGRVEPRSLTRQPRRPPTLDIQQLSIFIRYHMCKVCCNLFPCALSNRISIPRIGRV